MNIHTNTQNIHTNAINLSNKISMIYIWFEYAQLHDYDKFNLVCLYI